MKFFYPVLGAISIAACVAPVVARADTQLGDFNISGNAGLVTDYVFRGVSQTDEGPAVQGGFDIAHALGFYAGVWGSNVDFNDGDEASVEIDYYLGFSNKYQSFDYGLGLIYYSYPGAESDLDYDFVELTGSLGYDFDIASLNGSVNYSPDFFGSTGAAFYYAAALDVPLPYDLSFNAHAGHQTIDEGRDYTDWSLGLGYNIAGFDLSLAYHDTDLHEPSECQDGCGERVVVGVSRSF